MKQPNLTNCPTCHGTGKVELEGALKETLAKFTTPTKRLSANDLHDPDNGKTKNATNNRLEKLRKLGLLERERAGRVWTYFRATPPAAEPEAPASIPGAPTFPQDAPKKRAKGDGTAAASAARSKANSAKKGNRKK